jgi:hypothetical protein
MVDSKQRSIAANAIRRAPITDGDGNVEFRKPGYRYSNTSSFTGDAAIAFDNAKAAKQAAYAEYERRQTQAYRDQGSSWPPATSTTAPNAATGSDVEAKLEAIRKAVQVNYAGEDVEGYLADLSDDDIMNNPVEDHLHAMEAMRRLSNNSSQPIPSSDAASIAARSAAHQQKMNVIYEEEAARLQDAWRHVT